MKSTDTIVITKRRRGRPTKAEKQANDLLFSTKIAIDKANRALAKPQPVSKAGRKVKPFSADAYKGTVAHVFKRAGKDHEVVVMGRRKVTFRKQNYDFLDLRLFYYHFDKQAWFPTQKGATVPVDMAPELITAIASAVSGTRVE